MRSALMGKKSIPSCKRESSPIPTPSSRPSARCAESLPLNPTKFGSPTVLSMASIRERPPSNSQPAQPRKFPCWSLVVRCSKFLLNVRRVMGAWWPSRSSKPSPRHFVSRGEFDSHPLRHFQLRFAICDCRLENYGSAALPTFPFANQKSKIANPKGGVDHVA